MKLEVKGLRAKSTASGIRFYWEPNAAERRAKWTSLPLGTDLVAAVKAAEARNAEIEHWRMGGASPRTVSRFTAPRTFGSIIARYRAEHLATKAESTQRVNKVALARLDAWAGDKPTVFITRQRVRVLRDAMIKGLGHDPAFKVLKAGRELCGWAVRQELMADNPFLEFGLAAIAPRYQIWEADAIAAFDAAAHRMALPSVAFAMHLAEHIGQREGDLLKLTSAQWRPVLGLDKETAAALAHDDGPDAGKVMGFYIRQGKGNRWVGVPVAGDMRRRVESVIAANAARASLPGAVATANLIVNDRTGLPYRQHHFIQQFAAVRAEAIAAAKRSGQTELAATLATLQFRDLRRTCVVRLGELGLEDPLIAAITGHKLASIKKILEVYMPRTTKMAARAMVAHIGQADRQSRNSDKNGVGTAD